MTRDEANSDGFWAKQADTNWSMSPILLFTWVALLFLAHRDALGFSGRSTGTDPIESFFFEAGATVPALHYAAFAYVIWTRREALRWASPREVSPLAGIICALLGCLLFGWARLVDQLDMLIDSLTLLLAAGSLWIGGWRRLGLFVLPLTILWLARPWPPMVIHSLHETLQTMTGSIAVFLLSPFGATEISGHILGFGDHYFEVIEGCSGLRSTLTLVFSTLVYAEIFSRSRRQTIGLVAIAIMLGLGVNGLRVVSIMLAPGADASSDHSIQGLVMISVGVLLVAAADALGDRWLWPRGSRSWRHPETSPDSEFLDVQARWVPLLVLSGSLVVASFIPLAQKPPESVIWKLHEIRREMGPWHQFRVLELDHDHMGSVGFRDKLYREYVRGNDHVFLFVGADDRRRRDQSSLSPRTRLPDRGWETVEFDYVELPGSGRTVERLRQRRVSEDALTFHFRLGAGDLWMESLRWIFAYDLRPGQRPVEHAVVRVTARIIDGDAVRAQNTLFQFMAELERDLDRARPTASP
jgi:exosortase